MADAAASVTESAATEDLKPATTILNGMRVYFVIGAAGWLAFELGRVKLQRAYYCREGKAETTNGVVTRCHDAKVLGWLLRIAQYRRPDSANCCVIAWKPH